jgi:hypothetical protein
MKWQALVFGLLPAATLFAGGPPKPDPIWSSDPVTLASAISDEAYSADLSAFCTSPTGEALSFSIKSGPAWLTVSAAGQVTGTPAIADVGQDTFTAEACDAQGDCADTEVDLTVVVAATR